MKHKKGLIILIILTIISLIGGIQEIISTLADTDSFSFHFSRSRDFDEFDDEFFDDYDDEDFDDEAESPLGKIISLRLGKNSSNGFKNAKNPYISVIYITGVISEENKTYNQKWLLRTIKNAKSDKNNRALLLFVDSPGGTVYESDEAYLALMDYKKSTGRTVYAYFGSLAASGGYYIASAADYIYANRNSLTGSIGVIAGQSIDATALLEKLGIKMTTITAGRNKNMGNYNSVLTDEQRAILQSIADEAYEQFTGIVAEARDLPIETVKVLADGRIYTAQQAKNNGLIDAVCSLEDAKSEIRADFEKNSDERVNFIDAKYHYEENWMSLLYGAAGFIDNPTAAVYELLGKTRGTCLYLYQ
ncbi:MAG: signal peptide peptidase SppA [Treponema sp.]|nr:signal peptide peptidase SppA [Treponema sp.]